MRIKGICLVILLGSLWPIAGCGQPNRDADVEGLSAVVFNYSEMDIISIVINNQSIHLGYDAVPPGEVSGGKSMCCFSLDPSLDQVEVKIQPADGDAFVVTGRVEQPWPKDASTMIIHVLPKRSLVIETTLGVDISPRSDLINARLSELGIAKEVNADEFMIPERNKYTEYMEVKRR